MPPDSKIKEQQEEITKREVSCHFTFIMWVNSKWFDLFDV